MFFFPANTGKLNCAGNGASTRTIGAYGTDSNTKLSTGSNKRETIPDTPDGKTICGRLGMLVEHVSKKSVSSNLDIKLGPFSFPAVFTQHGT